MSKGTRLSPVVFRCRRRLARVFDLAGEEYPMTRPSSWIVTVRRPSRWEAKGCVMPWAVRIEGIWEESRAVVTI
jgi:hypothetical protein